MHSKIKVLFLISTLIFITSACNKGDLDINNSSTPTIVPVQTEKPISSNNPSNDTVINEFSDIGLFEGSWFSENQTEIVFDSEGGIYEDSLDDESCNLTIKQIDCGKIQVNIYFTSNTKKTINNSYIVAFDKEGKTAITNINDEIKSIKLDLDDKGYSINADFEFNEGFKPISFVKEDMLEKIRKSLKVIRQKMGLEGNRGNVDGEDVIIRFSSIDDSGILINVIRAEDTVVRGRYLFNTATLEYENITN